MVGQYLNGSSRNWYQYEELSWFGSGWGLLEGLCECGIEPPGFRNHGLSKSGDLTEEEKKLIIWFYWRMEFFTCLWFTTANPRGGIGVQKIKNVTVSSLNNWEMGKATGSVQ